MGGMLKAEALFGAAMLFAASAASCSPQQADRTLDRASGGLGLGLALVKGLVDLHQGEVSAHSEGLGKGAEFTVRIPLAAAPSVAVPASPRNGAVERRRRVLIIEDDIDVADALKAALEIDAHQVADRVVVFRPVQAAHRDRAGAGHAFARGRRHLGLDPLGQEAHLLLEGTAGERQQLVPIGVGDQEAGLWDL